MATQTAQDFEDLLHFARRLRGLQPRCCHADPEAQQLTLHTPDAEAADWITYLSQEGFRFEDGMAYARPTGTAVDGLRAANVAIGRPRHRVTLVIETLVIETARRPA